MVRKIGKRRKVFRKTDKKRAFHADFCYISAKAAPDKTVVTSLYCGLVVVEVSIKVRFAR
jgi:hypothetical protein